MSRVKPVTVFNFIKGVIDKTGVACVLIGGFAVNYYKVTRQTADVDFLITREDFDKIAPILEEKGYKKDLVQTVFARVKDNGMYLMDIDFMFVDRATLEKAINSGQKIKIADEEFTVPSLENLIALKLHSIRYNPDIRRHKDLPDIINLIKINGIEVREGSFKQLCLKFGTEALYDEILKLC